MQNKLTKDLSELEFKSQTITLFDTILDGKINAIGTITLSASSATTLLQDRRIGSESAIILVPTTANAAAAIITTYQSAVINKFEITINHTNNAQTDRVFRYVIIG